ncbi:hypothetical protein EB796_002470 [Bugula neritina]|uniref:Uncharacterized protein n=1 Tax=Bugula neritina TaxID=10212 RepID=A0A7J7KM50_BUGNE|nr:hypothetical protein EB796_002470 [Bugula neritina]
MLSLKAETHRTQSVNTSIFNHVTVSSAFLKLRIRNSLPNQRSWARITLLYRYCLFAQLEVVTTLRLVSTELISITTAESLLNF